MSIKTAERSMDAGAGLATAWLEEKPGAGGGPGGGGGPTAVLTYQVSENHPSETL